MATLPCQHQIRVVNQIDPTIDLLKNMDEWHPDVLLAHGIEPDDYNAGLVFRSAVESIRGTFIASSTTGRQGLVSDVLEKMRQSALIVDYKATSSGSRCDFEVAVEPNYYAAVEVKGGEGNSINISERRLSTKEFYIWSHLDGAIRNQPAHGAHSVLNRITNESAQRNKLVDVVSFKDILCGTTLRPCPKYPGQESAIGLHTAPDVFLLPQRIPSTDDPEPPVHTLQSVRLPIRILDLFGVKKAERSKHIWEVHVKLLHLNDGRMKRLVQVVHQGKIVSESNSRAWTLAR